MKLPGKPLLSSFGEANWTLLSLGVGMIASAILLVPGSQSGAASLLIVLGAAVAVAGALAGRFSELEIGPNGIKVSREDDATMPMPWLVAEAETLSQVAQVVLGSPHLAQEIAEDAISRVDKRKKEIPRSRVDLATFKTLVALLERAENKRWFSGFRADQKSDEVQAALLGLPLAARISFALSLELPATEVAEILGRSEADIASDVEAARAAVSPHLGEGLGEGRV
jgi:hypothetical protein